MENIVPTSIRLSKEVYEKVARSAKAEKRSITKQIEYMIEKYYEAKKVLGENE